MAHPNVALTPKGWQRPQCLKKRLLGQFLCKRAVPANRPQV